MTQDQENKIREEFMNEFAGIGSIDLVHNGEEQWQEFVNRDKDVLDWWLTKMKEQIEIAVRERDEEIKQELQIRKSKYQKTRNEQLERGNMMIAYDMDSRYYAIHHFLESLSTSPKE